MSDAPESRLASLEAKVSALEARLASLEAGRTGRAELPQVDIDDPQYGDPVVRRDPPRWKGASRKGDNFSRCPPDFLKALAAFLQWKAAKNDAEGEKRYAGFARLDAARALAWAERNTAQEPKQAPLPLSNAPEDDDGRWGGSSFGDDGDIPF